MLSAIRRAATPIRAFTRPFAYRPASSAFLVMAAKRKRSTIAAASAAAAIDAAVETPILNGQPPSRPIEAPAGKAAGRGVERSSMNPDKNGQILDAPDALRASPDSDVNEDITPGVVKMEEDPDSPLSDAPGLEPPKKKQATKATAPKKTAAPKTPPSTTVKPKAENEDPDDPEAEGEEEADEEELKEALSRPPPVNSDYLPLPWKGRLGYVGITTCMGMSMTLIGLLGLPKYIPPL